MAISYTIDTELELNDLRERLDEYAKGVEGLWEMWGVSDDLGPFHEEIMKEYGINEGFKTYAFTRHSKDRSVEAREELLVFYESLPGRKLLLMDDTFIDYTEPGTH